MTDAGFFRGTSSEQDNRFSDKEKKLLKQMKFADSLQKKIDMSKVNLNVLKPWISGRVSELLGMEDDVLNEFVFNQLEADNNPDGRRIQINLTGFLNGKNARVFMGELWDMLLDAMEHEGVPTAILDAKKTEIADRIKQEQEDQQKHQKAYESTLRSHHHESSDRDRRGYHRGGDDRDGGDRGRHSHQSSDFGRRSSRFNDDSDRNRDRDRDSGRPQHGFKRSRFSDTQNETEPLKRDERDSSRHAEHVFEEKTVKKLDRYEEEDAPKVEMKKHKKSKHRHHRKRHDSSSGGGTSQSYEEDDEDEGRRGSRKSDKKKKKKSKKQRHTSRSRSRDRSEDRSLEQELRDRALESMRRQKEVRK